MTRVIAATLKVGDTILPPARELKLWMRRRVLELNLPETALHLTITDIRRGSVDKGGLWLVIISDHTPEWLGGHTPYPFTFKVRPDSLWPKIP